MRQVRAAYIDCFHRALASFARAGRTLHSEICMEMPDRDHVREIYRLYVFDVVEKNADGSVRVAEINIDPRPAVHPLLNIDAPLAWNGIEFYCRSECFPEDRLAAWGQRWISDEHPPLGAQDDLTGIIHSLTEPSGGGDLLTFSVDFGSAPLEALEELVRDLGSHIVRAGSYSLLVDPE